MVVQESVVRYGYPGIFVVDCGHSGNLIYPVFSYSAITGKNPNSEGTVFHSTEFVNAFCLVMMQWHSEAEPVLVPNSMHSVVF
jgi:hypothetical protein